MHQESTATDPDTNGRENTVQDGDLHLCTPRTFCVHADLLAGV